MWWECTECGGLIERLRPPAKCRYCGQTGIYFVPADVGDRPAAMPDGDELRRLGTPHRESAQGGRA